MEPTLKQAYSILRTIYFALITGVVIFQTIIIFMNDWELFGFKEGLDPMNIASVILLLTIPIVKMVSDKLLTTITPDLSAQQKFAKMQSALIIRWAGIEGVALFSIVVYMTIEDGKQLVIFFLSLLFFVLANPKKERVCQWARLSEVEKRQLE